MEKWFSNQEPTPIEESDSCKFERDEQWASKTFEQIAENVSRAELISLLELDHQAGLYQLMIHYGRWLHSVAYGIVYNYDLAQDAVSIAWHEIYKKIEANALQYENLFSYLYTIVYNEACTLRRQEQRQRLRISKKRQAMIEEHRRTFETPEEALVRSDQKQLIHKLVNLLPPNYREIIQLCFFLDEEVLQGAVTITSEHHRQIAMVIGCTEQLARKRKQRALERLKELLKAYDI